MANIEISDGRPTLKPSKSYGRSYKKIIAYYKPILVSLIIIAFLVLIYGYIHTRNQLKQLSNPKSAALNETQELTNKVGELVVLPSGETPTIATVNDKNKLQGQTFFKNVQNGDKLLIYSKAGEAILYRPSDDKVIQYSYVNLGSQ
jgi:hypothetical protein